VKVVIGPADLSFQLWFDGEKISKDNPVKVEWQATTAPSPAVDDDAMLNTPAVSKSRGMRSSVMAIGTAERR